MERKPRSVFLACAVCAGTLCAPGVGKVAADDAQVESAYLKDPSRNLARLTQLADFFVRAKDTVNGGFYSFVDRTGAPTYPFYDWWHQQHTCSDGRIDDMSYHLKSVAAHSRVAYLYARAFMVTGRKDYLAHARHALDFMYEHGWDETHEGWWFTTNEHGEVAGWIPCDWWDPNNWKWTYAQMYPLVGIGAYVEATGSKLDKAWLRDGLAVLDDQLWDDDPAQRGYFTDANLDWSNPRGKGFTPSVDAITTHALAAHLLTEDPAATERLLALADNVVDHLIPSMDEPDVLFGFGEQFDASWVLDRSVKVGNVGHVLKAAWVLARAYLVAPDPRYRDGAKRLIDEVRDHGGYDAVNGAPYRDYDWSTGRIDQTKGYWEIEQAVMAGLVHHMVASTPADRQASLQMADESLQFFHDHFWDTEYGGHYYVTDAQGNVTDATKSDTYEQGYHVAELLYLSYLYGSLFLKESPVQLHYQFDASSVGRSVRLNPMEITSRSLRILSVRRDGRPYHAFDRASRTLYLPAGVGGTFRVTFRLATPE